MHIHYCNQEEYNFLHILKAEYFKIELRTLISSVYFHSMYFNPNEKTRIKFPSDKT